MLMEFDHTKTPTADPYSILPAATQLIMSKRSSSDKRTMESSMVMGMPMTMESGTETIMGIMRLILN